MWLHDKRHFHFTLSSNQIRSVSVPRLRRINIKKINSNKSKVLFDQNWLNGTWIACKCSNKQLKLWCCCSMCLKWIALTRKHTHKYSWKLKEKCQWSSKFRLNLNRHWVRWHLVENIKADRQAHSKFYSIKTQFKSTLDQQNYQISDITQFTQLIKSE